MVQTISSPTDVVEFLTTQHEQIKSMFTKTLAASGKAREDAFIDLRRLLAVHETVVVAREIAFARRVQLGKNRNQLNRQIVHAVVAHVLKRLEDRAFPGA